MWVLIYISVAYLSQGGMVQGLGTGNTGAEVFGSQAACERVATGMGNLADSNGYWSRAKCFEAGTGDDERLLFWIVKHENGVRSPGVPFVIQGSAKFSSTTACEPAMEWVRKLQSLQPMEFGASCSPQK